MESTKKHSYFDFVPRNKSNLQEGLDKQRELFKKMKIIGNYELMVSVLENIKIEIKPKITDSNAKQKIKYVETFIVWYRTLPLRYRQRTKRGIQIIYPQDIEIKLSARINRAYEILVEQMNYLGLL